MGGWSHFVRLVVVVVAMQFTLSAVTTTSISTQKPVIHSSHTQKRKRRTTSSSIRRSPEQRTVEKWDRSDPEHAEYPLVFGLDVGRRRLGWACVDRRTWSAKLGSEDLLAELGGDGNLYVRDWSKDDVDEYAEAFIDRHEDDLRLARIFIVEHQMKADYQALAVALRCIARERFPSLMVIDAHKSSLHALYGLRHAPGTPDAERYRANKRFATRLARSWLDAREFSMAQRLFAENDGENHPDAYDALWMCRYAIEHTEHMFRLSQRLPTLRVPGSYSKKPTPARVIHVALVDWNDASKRHWNDVSEDGEDDEA